MRASSRKPECLVQRHWATLRHVMPTTDGSLCRLDTASLRCFFCFFVTIYSFWIEQSGFGKIPLLVQCFTVPLLATFFALLVLSLVGPSPLAVTCFSSYMLSLVQSQQHYALIHVWSNIFFRNSHHIIIGNGTYGQEGAGI